jgi:Mor family transcriptional regulator
MPDLFAADDPTRDALAAALPPGLHPTLREMVEEMFLHLVEDEEALAALGVERLAELAVGQVDRVAMKLGGSGFYLPKGIGAKMSARDREIVQAFNGRNKHQLARLHGVSEMRIDQILKKWRQDEFAKKQGRLDLDGALS